MGQTFNTELEIHSISPSTFLFVIEWGEGGGGGGRGGVTLDPW